MQIKRDVVRRWRKRASIFFKLFWFLLWWIHSRLPLSKTFKGVTNEFYRAWIIFDKWIKKILIQSFLKIFNSFLVLQSPNETSWGSTEGIVIIFDHFWRKNVDIVPLNQFWKNLQFVCNGVLLHCFLNGSMQWDLLECWK